MSDESTVELARYDNIPCGYFDIKKTDLVEQLFSKVSSFSFIQDLISRTMSRGILKLPSASVFGGEAICVGSFLVNYQNYLIFEDLDGSFFVCGQRHLFFSDIYFPHEGVVLKVDHAPFQGEVVEKFSEFSAMKRERRRTPVSFLGFFVSYSRPYHYFYDLLPAFKFWVDRFNLENDSAQTLVSIKESSYLDLDFVYDVQQEINFSAEEDVNKYLSDQGGFLLKMGYPLELDAGEKLGVISEFDSHLISLVMEDNNLLKKVKNDLSGEVSIWIGMCNEKRKWVEQDQGISLVIKKATEIYGSVTIILDGMTRPCRVSYEEFKNNGHVRKELKTIGALLAKYAENPRVNFVSLVGCEAITKIAYALNVGFFVSNFLTDSMYPARFGQVPGVGHGSFKAKYTDHFHPKTTILKSKKSFDKKVNNKSNNWARQSYSINPDEILSELDKLFHDDH